MGKNKKSPKAAPVAPEPPKLALRHANRKSSFKMGRTISEQREKLETANERAAARKKDKKRKAARVLATFLGFGCLVVILICLFCYFFGSGEPRPLADDSSTVVSTEPTIEVVDENNSTAQLPSRIKNYIALAEQDFRDRGFTPLKAVIPSGAIREVDFYLDGHPGFIKMTVDRDSAISVEDAERLYRYLDSIGVKQFSYIDVRIDGKAYWK